MSTPPVVNYGADATGLICGFQFDEDGRGVATGTDQALQWLAQTHEPAAGGFVWLHFNLAHTASEKWLREQVSLSNVFYESLKNGSRSTRVEIDDDTLVAVVNDVNYDFAFEPSDVIAAISTMTTMAIRNKRASHRGVF